MKNQLFLLHKVRKYDPYLIPTYRPGKKLVGMVRGYIYNPYLLYLLAQTFLPLINKLSELTACLENIGKLGAYHQFSGGAIC